MNKKEYLHVMKARNDKHHSLEKRAAIKIRSCVMKKFTGT